jgi:hypothetical protein
VDLTAEQAMEIRNRMPKDQDEVAKALRVSQEIVRLMTQDVATVREWGSFSVVARGLAPVSIGFEPRSPRPTVSGGSPDQVRGRR